MTNIETTRSSILAALSQHSIDDYFDVVDAPRKGWKNNAETIVLRLRAEKSRLSTSIYTGFYLAKTAFEHGADEVDEAMTSSHQYFRITFVCDHSSSHHFEDVEVDTMTNGEHDTYNSKVAVCDDCDTQIEGIDPPSDDDSV